ncbi:hypothetical protein HanRHA438_Chr13g0614261 [Helianthus annuus]|uniref:Uncharacterized protein n=1 Tax=Helianthus annuus TaxID=4232 RepID=A0A9K3HBM9_HELAN|nr:hypothetical protein HanXRQr2_Chr13g0603721 [Helianthus annuus]KAJ0478000.1 hypothetical protein HanHA300_Chr13g0495231 [Helianthus annuus]KAJ0498858.1 hypothetical protein HanHA89_Chr13g0527691 [Helianthus annuus]KAJ0664872.1 hypothetical protein HanLR1_Chr13g0497711 [Helianthus annuus]KAJ0850516.1 hypothetical protein HanPSC8_Chr13g0581761 [Helianthus annuus]
MICICLDLWFLGDIQFGTEWNPKLGFLTSGLLFDLSYVLVSATLGCSGQTNQKSCGGSFLSASGLVVLENHRSDIIWCCLHPLHSVYRTSRAGT